MEQLTQDAVAAPGHVSHVRVRYAETDQMGVVYHANYLIWMEIGRVELVRSLGVDYKELEETEGLFLTVIEANCRYLSPARYDDEIAVETRVNKTTPRTVEFTYLIRHAALDHLLAEGFTRHVWISREFRPARLPQHYQSRLQLP